MNHNRWTYVGKLPEHVRFELKSLGEGCGLPTCNVNYIVLPLDTEIRTAKDLCEAKADDGSDLMSDSDYIARWDVQKQERYIPNLAYCWDVKNDPFANFDLNPGEVYLITVQSNKTWTQKWLQLNSNTSKDLNSSLTYYLY